MAESRRLDPAASATIATIANEVGVSVATVSKVLNGRGDVAAGDQSPGRGEPRPPPVPRRVRRQPTGGGADRPGLPRVRHGLGDGDHARRRGGGRRGRHRRCRSSQLDGAHRPPQRWLDGVARRRPLGVLFVLCPPDRGRSNSTCERQGIPFVVVDTDSATSASVPTVGLEQLERRPARRPAPAGAGAPADRHHLRATRRAVQPRPRRRLPVGPRRGRDGGRPRAGPLRQFLRRRRARPRAGTAPAGPTDPPRSSPARTSRPWGCSGPPASCGLRVPEDLSVIGYDNLPVSAWIDPALTTINQPLRDMAGIATQMLLDLTRGERAGDQPDRPGDRAGRPGEHRAPRQPALTPAPARTRAPLRPHPRRTPAVRTRGRRARRLRRVLAGHARRGGRPTGARRRPSRAHRPAAARLLGRHVRRLRR